MAQYLGVNLQDGWHKAKSVSIYVDGSGWQTVKGMWINDNAVWNQFYTNGFNLNITFNSDTPNVNVTSIAISQGWDQIIPLIATITINSGIYLYGNTTSDYAFDTGSSLPAGSNITLINNGTIIGKGGAGGQGGYAAYNSVASAAGYNGNDGGPGMRLQYATTVKNYGIIGGGGGGGGGGGQGYKNRAVSCAGGGGGGGASFGAGGPGGTGNLFVPAGNGQPGSAGTIVTGGAGGAGGTGLPVSGGTGGTGGGIGQAGGDGSGGYWPNGAGGNPGAPIVGSTYATYDPIGVIYGINA